MAGASTVAALFSQRVVVGVGDLAVSNSSQMILSTYALGSCIGLVAYDGFAKAGGILHLMLPESTISPEKAARQPAMFADSGLPLFFRQLAGVKAERSRLRLFVAGGASVVGGNDPFRIGERNARATLDYLAANGLSVAHAEIGGTVNRTLHLELSTGSVTLKTPTATGQLSLRN
jgi:chemotaxis protein CheD